MKDPNAGTFHPAGPAHMAHERQKGRFVVM